MDTMLNTLDHTLEALARGDVKGFLSTQPEPVVDRFVAAPLGQMRYRCVAIPGFAREYFAGGLTLPGALEATAILFARDDQRSGHGGGAAKPGAACPGRRARQLTQRCDSP
ncbi:HTH-type transcriptional regulator ArgP [Paraburkholderia phenoliruptrix]|nr:HTH-type transcriptional regulator ArgP [Paraburkholderia phenoliruptrix]